MTTTFNSGLDLIARCLRGEGLNYAVSSTGNDEYILSKINNNNHDKVDDNNDNDIIIKLITNDVNFPLTISNSVFRILCDKWILPLIKNYIINGSTTDDDNSKINFELKNALKQAKDEFYKNGLNNNNNMNVSNININTNGIINTSINTNINSNTTTSTPSSDFEFKPKFEDEFQLQPNNRNDDIFNINNNNTNELYRGYGDRDLYPNGERNGNWNNPLSGGFDIGDPSSLPGIGGMYPTFDDPLFQQHRQQQQQPQRRGNGLYGMRPNIRYDDPTGGNNNNGNNGGNDNNNGGFL